MINLLKELNNQFSKFESFNNSKIIFNEIIQNLNLYININNFWFNEEIIINSELNEIDIYILIC